VPIFERPGWLPWLSTASAVRVVAGGMPRSIDMPDSDPTRVLWRYNRWRCEYSPVTPERGVFRLYDADIRVIEAECRPEIANGDFARTCRALVETADGASGS
jgi:hypothetical protein